MAPSSTATTPAAVTMHSVGILATSFAAPRARTTTVDTTTINIDAKSVLHKANPMYMGCHSDSGYVHEVTGWSSQMLFGESFERPQEGVREGISSYAWQTVIDSTVAGRATVALDATRNFSGWPSMSITLSKVAAGAASGIAGVANRGLGNEGLYLLPGKQYEGYFFASSDAPVTLEVQLALDP